MTIEKAMRSREAGVGLIELLVALLLFTVCVVSLTQMQFKAAMASMDNHQRAVALGSARAMIDRISVNNNLDALTEYTTLLAKEDICAVEPIKSCEANLSKTSSDTCSATEIATYDVWSIFCDGNSSISEQLVDYRADLTCTGVCSTTSDMTLRVSWISRVSDNDSRIEASTKNANGTDTPNNLDFVELGFRP